MRTGSSTGILLLMTLLAPASADADSQPLGLSHVAEVQLDPGALTPVVNAAALNLRDGVQGNLCDLPEIDCPANLNPALAGQRCTVDRVSFPGPISLRRRPEAVRFTEAAGEDFDYHPVQAVVPFDVRLTRSTCLADPSLHCAFGQDDAHASLSAVFDLSAQVAGGRVQICATYAATLLGPIDVSDLVAAAAIPTRCLPLDEVTALAGEIQAEIEDVQLSASSGLGRLGVRIWFAVPQFEVDLIAPATETYEKFLNGLLAPAPPGTDWSVFIGEQLLLRLARQNAFTQLQNTAIARGYGLFLDGLEHAPWFTFWWPPPIAAQPTGAVTLYVRTDAVGCDLHFSLSAVTRFRLDPAADQLVISGSVGYDASVSGCLLGLVPGAGELVEVYLDGEIPSGTVFALDGLCEISFDNRSFECALPTTSPTVVPFGGAPAVTVTIDELLGDAHGLAVGGALAYAGGVADPAATASASGFGYGWDSCSGKRAGWYGDLNVDGWGRLCSASIMNDPQDVYLLDDRDNHRLTLPKGYRLENRLGSGAPYPFQVQVRTTNGSGILSLPVPEAISNLDIAGRYAEMISQCDAKRADRIPGWFDPHWRIDPDPPVDRTAVLMDDRGRLLPASVHLQQVRFEAIGAVQRTERGRQRFDLQQQPLRLTAQAWVQPRGLPGFHVPVSLDLRGSFHGVVVSARARLVQLTLAASVSRRLEVSRSALPAGYRGLSFRVLLEADAMTLTGVLPAPGGKRPRG